MLVINISRQQVCSIFFNIIKAEIRKWLIDFNDMSTWLRYFMFKWLENGERCTFIVTLFMLLFLKN